MSTNASDIKDMIVEVGARYNIVDGVSGEYSRMKLNRQVTKPFIQEFFIEGLVSYDVTLSVGDVAIVEKTKLPYLTVNKIADMHADEIINYAVIFYKCNVSGELLRPSGEVRSSQTYQKTTQWQTIKENCYGLQTEPLYGHDFDTDEELGSLGLEKHELYLPSSLGVKVLDRYTVVSGEYYRVETIKKRRYGGVDVVELGEDTR